MAVTGLGLCCGLGLDLEQSWAGAVAGATPARRYTLFDPTGLDAPFGVELPDGADALFAARLKKQHRRFMTRGTQLSLCAALEAWRAAGPLDPERVGVVVGSTGTGYLGTADEDPDRILRAMSNSPAAWASLLLGLRGPAFVVGTACASGAYALASAFDLVRNGSCDAVLAGAGDSSLNRLDSAGFAALLALAEPGEDVRYASRPFDRGRTGFVMGEGAGFLVLERLDHARARGARVLATLAPPAVDSEAYNILSPAPDGAGMARTMARALALAGLPPSAIDHINAHGTSTRLNDLQETRAIEAVFGVHAASIAVSATKSMTGHCLAGAGGVEAVLAVRALVEGVVPPTATLREPDPELRLDYVPREARRRPLRHVMSNSFGFGGHNGVLIFSEPAGG